MGHFIEKIGVAIFLIGVLGSIASVLIINSDEFFDNAYEKGDGYSIPFCFWI